MKFWQWLVLVLVVVGAQVGLGMAFINSRAPQIRYGFHYVGKEQFSNVYGLYRYDKVTGRVDRMTYTPYPEDKASGTPQVDGYAVVDMETAASRGQIDSRQAPHYFEERAAFQLRQEEAQRLKAEREAANTRRERITLIQDRLVKIDRFILWASQNSAGYKGSGKIDDPSFSAEQIKGRLKEILDEKHSLQADLEKLQVEKH